MLLHGKLAHSEANGPGKRAVIFFQGCTLNCPGCHNPETHPFLMTSIIDSDEIKTWLLNLEGIEGVTFSGGEPMQHVGDLLDLCKFVNDLRPDWSIGMFTGYTQRELETNNWYTLHSSGRLLRVNDNAKLWDEVTKYLDFAVMGRFNVSKMTTTKPLCGSSNQDIVLFSDRYGADDFSPQVTEVTISGDGLVKISGFPGTEFIKAVKGLGQ